MNQQDREPQTEKVETKMISMITRYIGHTTGLEVIEGNGLVLIIRQKMDQKILRIDMSIVEEVLTRTDEKGSPFLQINFNSANSAESLPANTIC